MIVVSHRGPYRFEANGDGTFAAERGAGGVASALGAVIENDGHDATWIAAALSDDDRAAAASGCDRRPRRRPPARRRSIPTLHAMHYDVVSNGVLWFLFHDLFDRIRRPRFDHRFREAWDAYRAVNAAFAEATAEAAARGRRRARQRLPALARRPRSCASSGPTCGSCTSRTRRSAAPDDLRVLPTYAAEELCAALARNPAGFHTARWARSYHQSARDVLGRRAAIAPTFAASLGPDVDALEAVAGGADAHAAARALDDAVGDRLVIARTDRIEPSKNIVRGFLAYDRLLEARPGLRGRVVFVAMLYPSRQMLARIPRVRERDRAGRRARQRSLGHPRLDADPPRRARRLPALRRRDAALRRAAREPDQGRPQPRREGRSRGQPARRPALPLTRGRRVRGAAHRRDRRAPVRPRRRGGRTRPRARDPARRARGDRDAAPRRSQPRATPSDWIADLVAHAV